MAPASTGWIATGCDADGRNCSLGNADSLNSVFEFTYHSSTVWYDLSAVNGWTSVSAVGIRSCGGNRLESGDKFWCGATGCLCDPDAHCPDGSDTFPAAPEGCTTCPSSGDVCEGGKTACTCPNGASSNIIAVPT